jgi:hypothetical protein
LILFKVIRWKNFLSTGNAFTEGPYTAVSVRKGYDNVSVDASGNYWATADQTKIAAMVKDSKDGLDFQTLIKTDNPLSSPPCSIAHVSLITSPPSTMRIIRAGANN